MQNSFKTLKNVIINNMLKFLFVILVFVSCNEAKELKIFHVTDGRSRTINFSGARGWQVIFPGTKWCGDGDIAENYDDLGFFEDTDRCCRAHDHCTDVIFAGETKYGLENKGKFSRLNCQCDSDFYNCLGATESKVSYIIGNTYFSVLGGQCFLNEYPIIECSYYEGWGPAKRCIKYRVDDTRPKVYQWFDVPFY